MINLMREYVRFPTVEHFERFLYAVAYSPRSPAHINFKKSNIRIWRDDRNNLLRICLSRPVYSGIIQQFLREHEVIQVFRPYSYYILQLDPETNRSDQLLLVQSRVAGVLLDNPLKLQRACQLLKDYLYYTTFIQSLERHANDRRKMMDCFEGVQGIF
jgi:hypothetical protein